MFLWISIWLLSNYSSCLQLGPCWELQYNTTYFCNAHIFSVTAPLAKKKTPSNILLTDVAVNLKTKHITTQCGVVLFSAEIACFCQSHLLNYVSSFAKQRKIEFAYKLKPLIFIFPAEWNSVIFQTLNETLPKFLIISSWLRRHKQNSLERQSNYVHNL